jgi:hypothetical protein
MAANDNDINKSAAIREVLAQNGDMTAPAVVSALGKQGISVTAALVYSVKKTQQEKKAKEAKRAAQANGNKAKTPVKGSSNPAKLVSDVKSIAGQVGGMKNLKQLVDVLAE